MTLARQQDTPPPHNYMPDMDASDFIPPEYKLAQFTSRRVKFDGGTAGMYHCETTGDDREDLYMIVLKYQRIQTRWIKSNMAFPVCSSPNRVLPVPGGSHPGPCNTCPANRVDCWPGYNIVALRVDDPNDLEASVAKQDAFLLRVGGTSVWPWADFWTNIRKHHGTRFWAVLTCLGANLKQTSKGDYYVMDPTIVGPIEERATLNAIQAMVDQAPAIDIPAESPDETSQRTKSTEDARDRFGFAPLRQITTTELQQVADLVKDYPEIAKLIPSYNANAFNKNRTIQLNTGELGMLKTWIHQQINAKGYTPDNDQVNEWAALGDIDTLPF